MHQSSRHNRLKVPEMDLVAEIPHKKHGSAIYVRSGSPIIISTTSNNRNSIECLSTHLEGISVTSVYKPLGVPFVFDNQAVQNGSSTQVLIGDFKIHNTTWGYSNTNTDGESIERWAKNNSLHLVHDPIFPASFNTH